MIKRGRGSRMEWGRVSQRWGALVGVAILLAVGFFAMGQVHTGTISSPGGGHATLSYEFTGFIMGPAEDETMVFDEFPKSSTYRVDRSYESGTVPGAPGTKLTVRVTASVGDLPKPVFEDARVWVRLHLWGPGEDGYRVDDVAERLVLLTPGQPTEVEVSLDLLERHRHATISIDMSVGSRDVEAFPNGQKRGDRAKVQAGFNVVRGPVPTVRITYTPEQPVAGDSMVFTATASGFGGGSLHYDWYLNGTRQFGWQGAVATWHDASPGNHSVRVVVSDGQGATAEAIVEFSVRQFFYIIRPGDVGTEVLAIVKTIEVRADREVPTPEVDMDLYQGGMIKTGPHAEIVIKYTVGPDVRISPNSTYVVQKRTIQGPTHKEVLGRLIEGMGRFYFPKGGSAERQFGVETDTAITSIKGTTFTLSHIDGVTAVSVEEGEVEVTHKETGHTTTVRPGQPWRSDDTTPPPSDGGNSHTYGSIPGWYLMSVPAPADIPENVGSQLRMWRWNPATKSYDRPTSVQPTHGSWAHLPANTQMTVTQGSIPTSNATLNLGVVGWHMVSAPWTFPKAAIQVVRGTETKSWADAVAAGWVRNAIYGFRATDGAYTMPTTLHPWYGYWLDAKVAGLSLLCSYASRSASLGLVDDGPAPLVPLWAAPADLPPPPPSEGSGAGAIQVANVPNPITDVYTTTFRVLGTMALGVTEITVSVYDLSGKLVWQGRAAGAELTWHTDDLAGRYLANGVYLYQVTAQVAGTTMTSGLMKLSILR